MLCLERVEFTVLMILTNSPASTALIRLFTPIEGVALLETSGVCLSAVIGNPRSPNSLSQWQSESTSDHVHQQRSGLKQRPVKSQRTQGQRRTIQNGKKRLAGEAACHSSTFCEE
jgi:hypothetical protein